MKRFLSLFVLVGALCVGTAAFANPVTVLKTGIGLSNVQISSSSTIARCTGGITLIAWPSAATAVVHVSPATTPSTTGFPLSQTNSILRVDPPVGNKGLVGTAWYAYATASNSKVGLVCHSR